MRCNGKIAMSWIFLAFENRHFWLVISSISVSQSLNCSVWSEPARLTRLPRFIGLARLRSSLYPIQFLLCLYKKPGWRDRPVARAEISASGSARPLYQHNHNLTNHPTEIEVVFYGSIYSWSMILAVRFYVTKPLTLTPPTKNVIRPSLNKVS